MIPSCCTTPRPQPFRFSVGDSVRTVPVYEILAEDIKALGVDTVFGLLSDDICQLVATLDAIGVRFVNARHETNAVMMAAGYAAASGGLGVVAIGRGPAMANGMHGVMSAGRTGMPVLLISGEVPVARPPANSPGPDLKNFAARAVLETAGVRTFVPTSPDTARQVLAAALAEASLGRTAALLLPADVQAANIAIGDSPPPARLPLRPEPASARQSAVDAAAALIGASRRPIIVGGMGVHRAGACPAVKALAEKTGALLASTLKAKDLFRGHPYELGVIGSSSHSLARRYIDQADCAIAIGASLNSMTTNSGTALPAVPLVHIDSVRSNIGRWCFAEVAVVGDARLATEQLSAALPERPASDKPFHTDDTRRRIAAFEHSQDFTPAHTPRTVDPRALALALGRMLPADRHVIYDGGNFTAVWAYVPVPGPGHFTHTNDFGSVGLGLGAALGVARARPDCTTVLFIGDGGLLMSMGELETVVREDLPMVVLVMNDAAYGAEVHIMRSHGVSPAKARFPDVDFAPLAEALGFEVATIRTMDDLVKIAPLLAQPSGPVLLDCKINGDVVAPFISEFTDRAGAKS